MEAAPLAPHQENRLTGVIYPAGSRSTYTYAGGFPAEGEGLRRTAHEPGARQGDADLGRPQLPGRGMT